MGRQQKDFISDIVFFQHQDGMRLKVRRHFVQCRRCISLVSPESKESGSRGAGISETKRDVT
jgi:hypothetical protein